MLDRYLEPFLKADAILLALLPSAANCGFEVDGVTVAKNIWRSRAPQQAPLPFVLIVPPEMYDGGETGNGVSGTKFEHISICVVGDGIAGQVDAIRDRCEALITPLRKTWVPSIGTASKLYVHYVMVGSIRFHIPQAPDGGQEGFPQWEIPLRVAYK